MGIFGALGKMFKAGDAQANKAADKALDRDPIAVAKLEIETAADEVHALTPSLNSLLGQVTGLQRTVAQQEQEQKQLQGRIDYCLHANDNAKAAQYDQQLQALETLHTSTKQQLTMMQQQYETQKNKIKTAQDRILAATAQVQTMDAAFQISESGRKATELLTSFDQHNPASHLSTVGHAMDVAQQRIDANNAAMQVQTDLGNTGQSAEEAMDASIAVSASSDRLAARRAALGIKVATPDATTPVPEAPKA